MREGFEAQIQSLKVTLKEHKVCVLSERRQKEEAERFLLSHPIEWRRAFEEL